MAPNRHPAFSLGTSIAVAALLLSGCAANESGDETSTLAGTLDGAGSSAQASAEDVWVSQFQRTNAGVTINYDPTGSGAGREQFIGGGVDFAGSDSALSDEELAGEFAACAPGSAAIDLPVYVSPLVLVYNVDGVDNLRLDPAAIANIFSGAITRWNDPALVALNPDATLPGEQISAVHRSDDSGTTKNFADYLYQNVPEIWTSEPADAFPYPGEGAQGNSGVVSAVANGNNTIGYADASRVGDLSVAALQVGEEFVDYSTEAAAAIIDASPLVARDNPNDLVVDVDRTSTAPGVYPLVLVSYLIACEDYPDADQAELVAAYLAYVASPDGQAAAAESAGSAPLSADFSDRVLEAVASIR
ncbi:phosphate ABC transporter substrate-binding protein PstS [Cryobacterium zongtaii]|uniref:Phosphate-binding protein n=1 Tax=Cryobacterium zongtaii TaxID=1259217 RepID=A0A2S3ZMP2_9MICO|nr:phosphate ABC transporter substrate-binding protein PstS [Cryobacterium zongtaii]POH69823.1 phosphate ABC transporter substrate-binding protein PstS [Cryobacterium zongtaii]